ncbi:zona pellucida sperm-binding protein 4-like [Sander lucioperca]|uniref:zona pellucida sperm-binding protein 4-like n=1 Tax=Sander lucioperca TaxID=283035 RepID=UPI0016535ED7|nr:zona pellucida sperm-binding protein 4-like [Sander lucioperca]
MALKLICGCLLAVALLGCFAFDDGVKPQQPPQPPFPQKPQQPPQPLFSQKPQQPLQPPFPQKPQQPLQPPQKHPQQLLQPNKPQQPTEAFHSCEVAEQYKIQCGAPDIDASQCNAINCCFDGRMCYYGKSVTLQCTVDGQFIVVVARDATLPNLDLESVTLLGSDPACSPVGTTSAFAIYQFPVTACGTVMTEEPGVIIYQNRMSSSFEVAIGQNGAITRDSSFQLICQCRYTGISVEALIIEVQLVPPPPPVAALGPLNVELRLGNGICTAKGCLEQDVAYSSFYLVSDYPIKKVLRDPVYVEIRILERTDPNLVLTLGRCWATADPSPYSLPQWDLLIDGCLYRDDNYMTALIPVDASSGLQFPSHYRRFVFKMFTFVGTGSPSAPADSAKGHPSDPQVMVPLQVKVYIHCNTAVCQPSLANNCEPRCSRKRRDVLASVQRNSRAETTVVSSQELIIIDPSQRI